MTTWTPVDFGALVPGQSGVTATGTGAADGYVLVRKVTVFTNVPPGTAAVLPSSYASGSELRVLNRGVNGLKLCPPPNDQIETFGVGTYVMVAPGGNVNIVSFDPPAAPSPRTWWLT